MLYFIVVWTALLTVCGVIGIALLQGFQAERFVRGGDRLIVAEWMGLVGLAISLLAVSLVAPLLPGVGAGIALLGCAVALCFPAVRLELTSLVRQLSWQHCLGYFALVISIATLTVQPVDWIDSGLYHYGAVQWLAQYGTVTGVALIFSNLGFVSAWFALVAPFNPPLLEARGSAVANGFVLVLVTLQLAVYLSHGRRGKAQVSDGFGLVFFGLMLLAVLLYSLLRDIAVSASPDLPVTFLVGVVPWAMLVIANAPPVKHDPLTRSTWVNDGVVPLLLAVGAVSIKLTTLPLLLISSLFYLLQSRRSLRQLCLGGAIGLVGLAPLLLAGIKASGCPLYPSAAFCLDVPWRQGGGALDAVAKGTHGWTSWYGAPPAGQHPLLWALRKWLQSERSNQGTAALIGMNAIVLIGSMKSLRHSAVRGKRWVVAIGCAGMIFLMTTAPFFRFTLPYLLLFPSLLVGIWALPQITPTFASLTQVLSDSQLSRHRDRATVIAALTGIAVCVTVFAHSHSASHLLLPPPMQTVAVVQKQVNDLTYFSPQVKGELCWATPLPCGFEVESVRLKNADRGLAGGFVRSN